jgi:menaquinone-dependent protoporphyrinogen IX oxidase
MRLGAGLVLIPAESIITTQGEAMKRVLIAYFSRTGTTEKMAQFIAEGMRMGGCEVDLVSISKVNSDADIIGYDGYVFGCPTYHKDRRRVRVAYP